MPPRLADRIALPVAMMACAACILPTAAAHAADGPERPERAVAATVGGQPILASEVQRLVARATGGKRVAPAARAVLRAQALEELVERRLVLAYAIRKGEHPAKAEVDAALAELREGLEAQKRTLEDYLTEQDVTLDDLRRQLAWNLLWPRYAARNATEDRVAAYFRQHRQELDGTEVSVSHILLKGPEDAGAAEIEHLKQRARSIRRQIESGALSFAEAARRHSQSPSAAQGGHIGLIARHGAMVESFSRAAFALKVGAVSPPVVTPFGVHLIRCDATRPGDRELADVRKEVEEALARELLEKLADLEREHTEVRYTGAVPHFDPGTRDLIGAEP